MTKERNELKPIDIVLGDFIDCMGNVEMVTGIIQNDDKTFQIGHTGWNAGKGVIPDGILFSSLPIPLTEEWKVCLGIERFDKFPAWIEYVHQAQNYLLWALQVDWRDTINWDLLPKKITID